MGVNMDKKLKIIEAMDAYLPDVDGVINCMHNYCLNMYKDVDLNVLVPKNRKDYVDKQPYTIHRCKSTFIPIVNDYYGFPNSDKEFKKIAENIDCDIIHVHSPFNMAKFALKLAKKKNVPIVATFHSNFRPIFRKAVGSKLIAEMMVRHIGRRYNKFDEIFLCSPLVEKQLRSFGYTGKVTYLPFGTDFKLCTNKDELRTLANEKFGIDPDELVFIFVGRVQKLKRIDFILRSLKLVKDRGIKFRFYVIGKGPYTKKLQKLSKKLGFTDKEVVFPGFVDRDGFPQLYARADLLLFPSLYDNFGLVKVEAASFQTPGVYIDGSCAGYGVTDGVDGYLSQDGKENFASRICEIVSDREKLKEVGITASKNLYITWEDCTKILLKRLNEIIEEKKGK